MFQSSLLECVGISLISIGCLFENIFFKDHWYYVVYLIITAVFLTATSKKESLYYYRQNVDNGITYGLITVPTLLSVLSFDQSNDKFGNILNSTSLSMSLMISIYCLWVWSSKIKTLLGCLVLMIFLFNQSQSMTWILLSTLGVAVYLSCSVFILPRILPQSFSFGELSLLTQGIGIVLVDFGLKASLRIQYSTKFLKTVDKPILALQTIFVSWLLIVIVLSPVFYCMVYHETHTSDKLLFSICFYIGGILNLLIIFLPLWYYMLAVNPIEWLLGVILKEEHIFLIGYWTLLVAVSIFVIIHYHENNSSSRVPKTIVRKVFHFIAVMIYLPAMNDKAFVSLISGIIIILLLIIELIRIFRIAPFGDFIDNILQPLLDDNDKGKIITTHIYLLLGMTIPLWLYVERRTNLIQKRISLMSLYSGVISIGIGDSFASIIGKQYGVTKLPGSKKTWLGSVCCAFSQFVFILMVMYINGIEYSSSNISHGLFTCCFIAFLEGVSDQIDNIILPLYMFILLR